jgi:hypothetical protein
MEKNAKKLLKLISDKVSSLTDKKISQIAHAPNHNEWRAYIWQTKPHWEDIAWRVKEPNIKGEAELHLGFYSAKPSEELSKAISETEELAKGKATHLIKNENGIRLVWIVNLTDENSIEILFFSINESLDKFITIALNTLIKSNIPELNQNDSTEHDLMMIELPIMNTFNSFANWVINLNEDEICKSPDQYYQMICDTISNLMDKEEIDGDWTDNFESVIVDEFYKNLEFLQNGLEQWKSNFDIVEYANLSSESELDNNIFEETNYRGEKQPPIELQKIWHVFRYWGIMITGEHHPRKGNFISVFNDYETKLVIVKMLLAKTKEITINTTNTNS